MSKVKSWLPVQEKHLKKYPGNNITDPRNKTAIETYNLIEGNADRDRKYLGLKGLYIRRKGDRL